MSEDPPRSPISRSAGDQDETAGMVIPPGRREGPAPPPLAAPRRRPAIEKLLNGVTHVVEAAMAADAEGVRGGLLQRLDPRVKLAGLLALVLASVLVHHLASLLALLAIALALVALSRLGLRHFALRAWTFVPVFTLAVVLPAATSWVTPGHALVRLWGNGAVTTTGLAAATRIVLRVTDAVSFSVLLAMTTRWHDLLAALRALRVPRSFVFVVSMAYRYVFVLMRLVQSTVTARRSRTVGRLSVREDRRFVGAAVGQLFGHSQAMSEQIYAAMLARGYDGETRALDAWHAGRVDLVWSAAVAVAVAAVVALELTVTRVF
jgi:cobalt/nickel transport system permease protein